RVLIEYDEIGELPTLDGAEIASHADALGAEDRRRAEHVMVRHAARRHHPHLPLVAESLQLPVAADADTPAGLDDLLRERGVQWKGVFLVHEPAARSGASARSGAA